MVMVETAIAIPVLVTMAATLVWAVGVVMTGVSLGDACSRIAREVSRGADVSATVMSIQADRPGAQFDLADVDGGDVRVIGRERVSAPGLLRGFGFTMTRQVVVAREGFSG
jgi:hypothetical protein